MRNNNQGSSGWLIGLIVIIATIVIWFMGPALHWLWFDFFYLNPMLWILILLLVVVGLVGFAWREAQTFATVTAVVICILLGFYVIFAKAIADQILVQGLTPTTLKVLPVTTGIRYLPLEVANYLAQNRIADSSYVPGKVNPIDLGNELDWVAARVPNGLWNEFLKKVDGVVVIKPDGTSVPHNQTFQVGENMYVTSNIYWAIWSKNYFIELPEVYYLFDKEQVLALAPYISYEFDFPVMVPKWGGVMVVHGDGKIEDLTPEQAIADPRFVGQRLYPEVLERRKGTGWQFMDGIKNAILDHTDQAEFPVLTNSENQMPYLVPGTPNPYWFIAFEPYGKSFSTYKILLTDAHTGQDLLYDVPEDVSFFGPNSALKNVRAAAQYIAWGPNDGGNGTNTVIEPKPLVVKGGKLFWQASITSTSFAKVSDTAIVDAATGNVVFCHNLQELQQFAAGTFGCHNTANQNSNDQSAASTTPSSAPSVSNGSLDLTKMSDQDLRSLLQQIVNEMNRRAATK